MLPSPQGTAGKQMSDQDAGSLLSPGRGVPASESHQPCAVPLVLPEVKFAHLLKSIGAEGKRTPLGELFTINQLCFYLKEYIKFRELFDPTNPRTIHCSSDPLGQVFGVSQFTLEDALYLIKKNIEVIDSPAPRRRHRTPPPNKQSVTAATTLALTFIQRRQVYEPEKSPLPQDDENNAPFSPSTEAVECAATEKRQQTTDENGNKQLTDSRLEPETRHSTQEETEPVAGPSQPREDRRKSSPESGEKPKKKRKRTKSERPHGASPEDHRRLRRSSVSIIYNSDGDTGGAACPYWRVEVDLEESDETVYSIQSKETTVVKDSSDDLWFLDEDEEEVAIEIQSTHSAAFAEEYEVESTISSYHGNQMYMEYDSESPDEEIVVVCDESDRQFWADSESSDNEADSCSDEELSMDKWYCENCDTNNSPLSRHCARCWNVRPGWVSDKGGSSNQRTGHSLVPQHNDECKSVVMNRFLSSSADVDLSENLSIPLQGDVVETKNSHGREKDVSHKTSASSRGSLSVTDEHMPTNADCIQSSPRQTVAKPDATEPILVKKSPRESPKSNIQKVNTTLSRLANEQTLSSKPVPSLAKMNTIPVEDLANASGIFKVPSYTMSPNQELSKCSRKGRHLAKLELPSDDSGLGSLTSSQESFGVAWSQEHTSSPSKVPRKLNLDSNPFACSPKKLISSPRPAVSPGLQRRLLSPRNHRSPYPTTSSHSAKQTFFPFDPLLSPGKRLMKAESLPGPSYQQQHHVNANSSSQNFTEEPGATKKVLFMDPVMSPKKRPPNTFECTDVCMICLSKPKEASIIHGKTGHQVCCYMCAKKLRRRGKPCPVCRRPIQKVIKNYLV